MLLIGCDNLSEKLCLLPNDSEWVFAQGGVSFKVKKDSLFWKLDSDVQDVLPVGAVGRYKISHSGKIYLQSHLPLLTQDLAYVCGDKRAAVYRFISKVQQCKLDGDKLMFYSSDDSLIFYRKK